MILILHSASVFALDQRHELIQAHGEGPHSNNSVRRRVERTWTRLGAVPNCGARNRQFNTRQWESLYKNDSDSTWRNSAIFADFCRVVRMAFDDMGKTLGVFLAGAVMLAAAGIWYLLTEVLR